MRIAVTGATGFVGRALCAVLDAKGHRRVAIEDAQAVVHLAAIAHRRACEEDLQRVNVDFAVATACKAQAAKATFIFLSSVKVHGEVSSAPFRVDSPIAPQDRYAQSKARAEEALRAIDGLQLTIIRPPLVYGPSVRANFLALLRAVASGCPLPFAGIQNRRSLIYVGNLADAIVSCLAARSGGTFLVSDGVSISTPELCQRLARGVGRRAHLFPFPAGLLPRQLTASLEVDDTAIRKRLGWTPPVSLDEGLNLTAEWYKAR